MNNVDTRTQAEKLEDQWQVYVTRITKRTAQVQVNHPAGVTEAQVTTRAQIQLKRELVALRRLDPLTPADKLQVSEFKIRWRGGTSQQRSRGSQVRFIIG